MKIKKILDENPDIAEELRKHFKQMLLDSFKEIKVPNSFKEKIEKDGVTLKMVETYLNATPRLICDFMDEKNIIILPVHIQGQFSFTINGDPYTFNSDNRKDSEIEAVLESIDYYKNNYNEYSEKE